MTRYRMILSLLLAGMGTVATAQNINLPIIQTKYTADPAPYVHNDTVYLYTTHDEDGAEGFLMKDWLLYTSTDMVNWQDRGAVASLKDFKWFKGENGAWAEQVIERNGKWYMYCPIHGHGIGVLVADNPYGPFKDKNLVSAVYKFSYIFAYIKWQCTNYTFFLTANSTCSCMDTGAYYHAHLKA